MNRATNFLHSITLQTYLHFCGHSFLILKSQNINREIYYQHTSKAEQQIKHQLTGISGKLLLKRISDSESLIKLQNKRRVFSIAQEGFETKEFNKIVFPVFLVRDRVFGTFSLRLNR